MKSRCNTGLLASTLAMFVTLVLVISYTRTQSFLQLVCAFLCMGVSVLMFLRYRRLKHATPTASG